MFLQSSYSFVCRVPEGRPSGAFAVPYSAFPGFSPVFCWGSLAERSPPFRLELLILKSNTPKESLLRTCTGHESVNVAGVRRD